jgi:hypothetical protein
MSKRVRPSPPPSEDPASEVEAYRRAALEARAQAEALRRAVVQADALVNQLEQLVESLLAILEYPKAYEWPALPAEQAGSAPEAGDVTVVLDPKEQQRTAPGGSVTARERRRRTGSG